RNFAFIENYANDQILHFTDGAALSLTGGTTGIKHFAAIMGMGDTTSQQILGKPAITLTGGASGGGDGSGFFATFTGNNAYIGTDPYGPVATSQTIQAQSIDLHGGAGPNNAAIDNFRSGGQQTITALGDIRLVGGPGATALAELYSVGDQTVKANSITLSAASGGGFAALHVDGGGTQKIDTTGSNTNGWGVQLTNNGTSANVFIETAGQQSITASNGGGIVLDSIGGRTYIHGGAQTIQIDGTGSNALAVQGGLGSADITGVQQSITAGTGTHAGSILVQGGTQAHTTASITNNGGPQHVSTSGRLQVIAGSAPDQGQGNFRCDLQACANIGNETGATGQFVTAIGGITITGGSAGARNEANIYSRSGQTIDAAGGMTITAGAGAGPGNWASLAEVSGGAFGQNVSFGAAEITIRGGNGTNSSANIYADGSQTVSGTGNIAIFGGTANAALAAIESASGTQRVTTTGTLTLTGGTAPGRTIANLSDPQPPCGTVTGCAFVAAEGGKQTISANAISLIGGSQGNENFATLLGVGGQDITVGAGGLTMRGGTGTGIRNYAFIENDAGDQILRFASGAALTMTGGTVGLKHFAAIQANGTSTSQQILGNPAITLTGGASGGGDGSGSFFTFTGNDAYIGTDTSGTNPTSQTINAQSITLQAAFGSNHAVIANVRAGGQQSIIATGDIRMSDSATTFAHLYAQGDQTVQANSITMNGALGGGVSILADVGAAQHVTTTGSNAGGWGVQLTNNNATNRVYIETTGAQTITASNGGGVLLDAVGGEVDVKGGAQTIQIDGTGTTNALTVRGGAGLAHIEGDNQSITAGTGSHAGSIAVLGGAANGANSYVFNHAGAQTIATSGSITVTAGTGTSTSQGLFACGPSACALIANVATAADPSTVRQSITAGGTITIAGGASGSYNEASIFANGNQMVRAGGGIQLLGGSGTGNYASLATIGGANATQTIDFGTENLSLIGGTTGGRSFATVYSDGAQTISGQGDIVMVGGALSTAGTPATLPQPGGPVTDPVVYSWAEISNDGAAGASGTQSISARSISITARPGRSSTGIFTPAGQQIVTTGNGTSGYGIAINNLGTNGTDQNNAS
ncbi:MAG: hypothetical protein ABI831_25225, partial [Betaproteobacteria bacterium]